MLHKYRGAAASFLPAIKVSVHLLQRETSLYVLLRADRLTVELLSGQMSLGIWGK